MKGSWGSLEMYYCCTNRRASLPSCILTTPRNQQTSTTPLHPQPGTLYSVLAEEGTLEHQDSAALSLWYLCPPEPKLTLLATLYGRRLCSFPSLPSSRLYVQLSFAPSSATQMFPYLPLPFLPIPEHLSSCCLCLCHTSRAPRLHLKSISYLLTYF